ncbi:hypothetical protein ACQEVB_10025 [Pseudonocardia sp. CA-107938]|uniref:hypothetical protein n=1 Tax=Pseudonocardia sp. CA-107938 TaxID=3240021 RepID=UPI003D8AA32C
MRRLVQGLVALVLTTTPHPPPPTLFVPDGPIVPGMILDIGGTDFTCATVLATIGADPLGDPIAVRPNGTFTERVQIPADTRPGPTSIEASCVEDRKVHQSKDVTVVGPANRQRIVLTPRSARPGGTVAVEGTGFDDCIDDFTTHDGRPAPVEVAITLDGALVASETVQEGASNRGTFRTTFTVPSGIATADHQVVATCQNRFLPGTSTATGTLTVGTGTGPTTAEPRPSVPYVPQPGPPPHEGGSGLGIGVAVGVVVAALAFAALRRRPRPVAAAAPPIPRQSRGRLPDVAARSAGMTVGPVVPPGPGSGADVSVRVVARSTR